METNDKKKVAGDSKLLSPNPGRKKYLTELLQGLANRKLSFAEVTGLDKKKLRQVCETGFIKLKHGRFQEARKIFELLIVIDHKNPFHHLALGGTLQKLKRWVDSAYEYGQAIKYDQRNTNAYVNRGEIFLRRKNYRRAAEDFREAILLDEAGKDRYANRARSLIVAIKRSLERDKEAKNKPQVVAPRKKVLSPLGLASSLKKR